MMPRTLVSQGRGEAITSVIEQNIYSEVPTLQIFVILNPLTALACAFVS